MRITIQSIGETVTKSSVKGTPYKMVEVQFVSNGRAGKYMLNSFTPAFATIRAAAPGAEYEITTKQSGEYTNWDTATLVEASKASPEGSKAAPAKPFQSTYETAEERARKQVYIVRQSCLGHAIEFALGRTGMNPDLDLEGVLKLAKQFEAYVFDMGDDLVSDNLDDIEVK